jgi:hypothetical protein
LLARSALLHWCRSMMIIWGHGGCGSIVGSIEITGHRSTLSCLLLGLFGRSGTLGPSGKRRGMYETSSGRS